MSEERHDAQHLESVRRDSMTTEGFKRNLTAILGADVKGYSRPMREDEIGVSRMRGFNGTSFHS